jgi:hypothetical protein
VKEDDVMMTPKHWMNGLVLVAAFFIAVAPLFAIGSRGILTSGGSMAIGALIAIKGISRLRCAASDLVLACMVLGIALITVFTHQSATARLVFEIVGLSLLLIFASTGLTFRTIARDQRISRPNVSNGRP